jgi:hypothetical protein
MEVCYLFYKKCHDEEASKKDWRKSNSCFQGGVWKKQVHFFRNCSISDSKIQLRVAFFFKTEMENPSSNSTWNKMHFLSIYGYQNENVMMLHNVDTTQSSKTATDSRAPKIVNSSKNTYHSWYHSIDRKHTFLLVNFEVKFIISFKRNTMSNNFMWMGPPFFQKRSVKRWQHFWAFWFSQQGWKFLEDKCVDRVQNA